MMDANEAKADPVDIAALLSSKRAEILEAWRPRFGSSGRPRNVIHDFEQEILEGKDLLSMLTREFNQASFADTQSIPELIARVRHHEYQITDLYSEIATLETALVETLSSDQELEAAKVTTAIREVNDTLQGIFTAVLQETSEIYEYATENDRHGFCHLDGEGTILFANQEMHRILSAERLVGLRLDSFFDGDQADYVSRAIHGEKLVARRELHIKNDTTIVSVIADIRRLKGRVSAIGAYASFTDVSPIVAHNMQIFDQCLLAIARIDLDLRITYANRAFLEIIRASDWTNLTLRDFIKDSDSRVELDHQIENRFAGKGTQYEALVTPLAEDARPIPVSITGLPVKDSNERVIGAFGIMRDLRVERTTAAIHSIVATADTASFQELLSKVFDELYQLIPFDFVVISRFSASRTHAAPIFSWRRGDNLMFGRRWYAISPATLQLVNDPEADYVTDFDEFMERPSLREFRNDPAVLQMQAMGLNSYIRLRVEDKDQLAVINLFRRGKSAFREKELDRFRALPVREAVAAALYRQKHEELEFRYRLIKKILGCKNINAIAHLFVDEFGSFYKWDSTAIFVANYSKERFDLVAQRCGSTEINKLDPGYNQPLKEGILGMALAENRPILTEDVTTDPNVCEVYVEKIGSVRSEFCIPVRWDGKVRWLLVISDAQYAAFSNEEITELTDLVQEIEGVLENLVARIRLVSAFEQTSDAVFFTDMEFRIKDVNAAGAKMLGQSGPDAILRQRRNLRNAFRDPKAIEKIVGDGRGSLEVKLKRRGGRADEDVSVLMSSFEHPEEVPGRVFVAKDLTYFNRAKELEGLEELFYDLAIQTQTPLALAVMWLRQLAEGEESEPEAVASLATRILEQMNRVSVTFDRLALAHDSRHNLQTDKLKLNLATELKRALDAFPQTDREAVAQELADRIPYVSADPYQVSFVFRTLLSYLLRGKSADRPISVSVRAENGSVQTEFEGLVPRPDVTRQENVNLARTRAEMVLGERVIREFIERNHGGKYAFDISDSGEMRASVRLPAISGAQS